MSPLQADTIAALATAAGPGALAVVRVSGPATGGVLRRVAPWAPDPLVPRRATLASFHDPDSDELLDRGLITFFPGPDSYTGEDVGELSCHGGWLAPSLVLNACLAAGARAAEPGEFTRRAYLNGKVDLIQAEAVLDLIEGRSRALHRAALHQLDRGLSARISSARESLVHLEALLMHHIDFPEEDEPPVKLERVVAEAREVASRLEALLGTAHEGELLREGALTVLAGRPNSGKSSLFNALLGKERAIVTEEPGTTRDALEAVVSLDGYPFRLVDTAGIRDSEERVERMGIEVARRYLAEADIVLLCVEAEQGGLDPVEEEFVGSLEGPVVVTVRTKVDVAEDSMLEEGEGHGLAGEGSIRRGGTEAPDTDLAGASGVGDNPRSPVFVSSVTGRGLDELAELLPSLAFRGLVVAGPDAPLLTRRRQVRAVGGALEEVRAFARALEDGVPAEVAATHLLPAETALEELLGVISRDDVMDRVFGDFCIGK